MAALSPAAAQTPGNILVVINDASPASVEIGEYYVRARRIPPAQVVRLAIPPDETIARPDYTRLIEAPIAAFLARHGLQDQVLYIVLTKGVPIRIAGTGGRDGTTASVDSELTLLYRRMLRESPLLIGRLPNPYYLGETAVGDAKRFTRFDQDIYLVTRLDGYTVEDVRRLIDHGLEPSREGRVVLDQRAALVDAGGDRWLAEAARRLDELGAGSRVVLETTGDLATARGPVLGYYSWGSNDPANRQRGSGGLTFTAGALAGMFVSTDGRTFAEPPEDWRPGPSNRPLGQFGSGSQSMAADFIREGASGVAAHVSEPYLDGSVRPQVLFPAYFSGFNLAESFYLAMPHLSWQNVIIGDPLVAPFRERELTSDELHKGIDSETAMPALFAERRIARAAAAGLNPEAVKLALRAETHTARDDHDGAEPLMARAVGLEPRLTGTALQLAARHAARGEHDRARERYRGILAVEPENVIALNNLAYSMAIHDGAPKEALPLAQRAARRADLPEVLDTLAWIHHLLGDNAAAAPLIERAVAGAPDNAEIQLHAAIVYAAVGLTARARAALDAAERLDPALSAREDVKALRARISRQ